MKDVEILSQMLEAPWLTPKELTPRLDPERRTRVFQRLKGLGLILYAEGSGRASPVVQPTPEGRDYCRIASGMVAAPQAEPPPTRPKREPKPKPEPTPLEQAILTSYIKYYKHRMKDVEPKILKAHDKAADEIAKALSQHADYKDLLPNEASNKFFNVVNSYAGKGFNDRVELTGKTGIVGNLTTYLKDGAATSSRTGKPDAATANAEIARRLVSDAASDVANSGTK